MSLVHGKNLMTFGGGLVITDDDSLAAHIRTIVSENKPESGIDVRKKAAAGLANWALTTRPGFTIGLLPPFWVMNFLDRARLDSLFVEKPQPFDPGTIRPLSPFQARLGRMQLHNLDVRNAVRRHNAERLIAAMARLDWIGLPKSVDDAGSTWNSLPVRVADPADVQRELLLKGIDTRADYMTVYAFEDEWKKAGGVFYLPNHPGMNERDVNAVIRAVTAIARPRRGN
jgi:dTDP-4-amino-4,6-dideoxygalactose transaminase